jgi:hypothetical protein
MHINNTKQGLYANPALYDILYSPGTASEVDALQLLAEKFNAPPLDKTFWLEPACGTGRYMARAQRRGVQVAGFDIDTQQVDYCARRLKPNAQAGRQPKVFVADMAGFSKEAEVQGLEKNSVHLAFNLVNSLRHLGSDNEMLAHFADVTSFLRPGGIYIIGISLTDYEWLMHEEDLWEGARGRCKVSQLVNYLPPEPGTPRGRVESVISHLTVVRPRGSEHFDDTYDLRTYDKTQWHRLIKKSTLTHAGSFDAAGTDLGERLLPYQLEVLQKK